MRKCLPDVGKRKRNARKKIWEVLCQLRCEEDESRNGRKENVRNGVCVNIVIP
jgi:hypothetical protein